MTNPVPDTPKLPEAPLSIAIVLYEGAQMAAVLVLVYLFAIANRHAETAGQSGAGRIGAGRIGAERGGLRIDIIKTADLPLEGGRVHTAVVLPPNLSGARGEGDAPVRAFIGRQHAGGSTICSACAGLFWLAEAGLTDGRSVTTHWALEDEFLARFPLSQLATDRILIDDNDIVTAGGMMAWIDLGLFLVERHLGAEALRFTARQLLVDPTGRQQSNYRTFRPRLGHGDPVILRLQHWMEGNVACDLSVRGLAAQARLSERTFIRRFKSATGLTPNRYVQFLRIEKARALLEQGHRTVQDIGWRVGYQDISAFGRVFKSVTDTSPAEYRRRFGQRTA